MLALCSMLHPTDYDKKYAGIMGASLAYIPYSSKIVFSLLLLLINFYIIFAIHVTAILLQHLRNDIYSGYAYIL